MDSPVLTGIYRLARKKIGALIIIERGDRVQEFITEGQPLEGEPGPELLLSIFHKDSPLHDGAVLIRRGRITLVASYLPLSPEESLPKEWGTRHRAALGLSERCDAWVVVVSEERGEVSLARDGKMTLVEDVGMLSQLVHDAVEPLHPPKTSWRERLRSLILYRWQAKVASLFLVSLLWLLLAGQQDFEVALSIPLELKNVPSDMSIQEPLNPKVRVKIRGLRKDASLLGEKNVFAELDLSMARVGKRIFTVSRDHIKLPNDRIQVVGIEPRQIEFHFR